VERATDQSIPIPTGTAPTSVTFSDPYNFSGGISIGTLTGTESTGIWIRQTLSGIHRPDPYATFIISFGGFF
jgi:hypothetical protein